MRQKKKWWFIVIFVLFVFNLWQWWPQAKQTALLDGRQLSGQIHEDDLGLSGYAIENKQVSKVYRDLFVLPVAETNRSVAAKQTVAKKQKIKRPKKSYKRPEDKRKRSALGGFRLVGILFKEGEKNAYLVKGDKDYAVKKGDEIEGRYLVKEVTVSTVTLLDSGSREASIVSMQ